jgi:hypothetical protein
MMMYTDNEEEQEITFSEYLEEEKTFSQYLDDELHGRNEENFSKLCSMKEPLVDVDELGPIMKVVYYFFLFQFFLFCGSFLVDTFVAVCFAIMQISE